MISPLKIIGIQADLIWESRQENLARFSKKISQLSEVDLIVLPEMFTTGFTMKPYKVSESMQGKTINWMKKIAKEKDAAITGSIVIKENNEYFNRLLFVHPSGKIDTYDKKHTFTLAGESEAYKAGNTKTILQYNGWKICLQICYDLRFPSWARNLEDYDLLIYVANWPVARIQAWDTLLKARAIENMSYTIGVNRVGIDASNYKYSGNSLIVDYLGTTCASLAANEEGFVTATINKNDQQECRNKLGFLKDRDHFKLNL